MAACRRAAKPIASLSVITLKNKINTQPLLDKNLFLKCRSEDYNYAAWLTSNRIDILPV